MSTVFIFLTATAVGVISAAAVLGWDAWRRMRRILCHPEHLDAREACDDSGLCLSAKGAESKDLPDRPGASSVCALRMTEEPNVKDSCLDKTEEARG